MNNILKGKRVIVTGAGGFIGSHLAEELVAKGAIVRGLVHYSSRNDIGNLKWIKKDILDKVEIVHGDILDPFAVREAVRGCDIVYHLAALIGIPYSYIAPKAYVDTNVLGTVNVLEACRTTKVERVIHTSTSEVYGTAIYTPIDEKHPLQGQSPYSASKIGADKIAESYYRSFELPVVTVRPFNTYGPRQSLRAVIPTIISQLLAGRNEIHMGALSPVRDLTYVKDTVAGYILSSTANNVEGETINMGHGTGISIEELVLNISELCKTPVSVKEDKARVRPEKSEVLKLICNNNKAKEILGWEPSTSLADGLAKVIQFMSENMAIFSSDKYVV